jgi:hypothetical protein
LVQRTAEAAAEAATAAADAEKKKKEATLEQAGRSSSTEFPALLPSSRCLSFPSA